MAAFLRLQALWQGLTLYTSIFLSLILRISNFLPLILFEQAAPEPAFLLLSVLINKIPDLVENGRFSCLRRDRIYHCGEIAVAPEGFPALRNHLVVQPGQHPIGQIPA